MICEMIQHMNLSYSNNTTVYVTQTCKVIIYTYTILITFKECIKFSNKYIYVIIRNAYYVHGNRDHFIAPRVCKFNGRNDNKSIYTHVSIVDNNH